MKPQYIQRMKKVLKTPLGLKILKIAWATWILMGGIGVNWL